MATEGTARQLKIDGRRENPTRSALIGAFSNAFDRRNPGSVTLNVTDGSRRMAVVVQIIGLEYESGNHDRLNFKGLAQIDGREQRVTGYYATDDARGYIDIPAV